MNRSEYVVEERIQARGTWVAATALHTGGDDTLENNVDMSLLRGSGGFFIPAGSIAGAARNHLNRTFNTAQDYRAGQQPDAIHALFGDKYASLLSVSDAPTAAGAAVSIRDNVRLDSRTGIAGDRAKFNLEVLPAGAAFHFRMGLTIYGGMPRWSIDRKLEPAAVLMAFRALLEAFQSGKIRLGARTRRGFGCGAVQEWEVRRFNMRDRADMAAWLRRDTSGGKLERFEELARLEDLPAGSFADRSQWFDAEVQGKLVTSLLIRSGGADPASPDMVHLTEGGNPLVSGTSLAGALRHRVEKIANTMYGRERGRSLVSVMFGPVHEARRRWRDKGAPVDGLFAGRVWVDETPVQETVLAVQNRVAIDRFTGGALEAHLFDQAPAFPRKSGLVNAAFRVRLELRGDDADRDRRFTALLLQALKDLWLEDLTLGGEAGAGRGVFRGVAARFRHAGLPDVEISATGPGTVRVTGWNQQWESLACELGKAA